MEKFKQFTSSKEATIGMLGKLQGLLGELGEMGFEVDADLQKIASAVASVESDVLRIALLGAFSDGKTSVIAAWLGRIMGSMKIDMDESSDRVAIYRPEGLPGECEIVDTPGLFGDKVRSVDGEQVVYEDLTKRYISEAHLILYVVDATNPLKESHSDIVRWLLRDLNKLSSTVFVINKMDEVTDLTEPELFAEQAEIKKDNLRSKLVRVAGLSRGEENQLNIVCLASNPNGRGLDFWFSKMEQYEVRSRINDLKDTTDRILSSNIPAVLIAKTGLDVVRDVVGVRVSQVLAQLNDLRSYEQHNSEESRRIQQDLLKGRGEVKRLSGELFLELENLERQMLGQLRPLALEDIRSYLEDELGYKEGSVGYKLNLKIKTAIDQLFSQSSQVTNNLSLEISRELDSSQSFLDAMGGKAVAGASHALKGMGRVNPEVLKGSILAARNTLSSVTGVAIKFKPWGVTKLAGNMTKFAPVAGASITVINDLWEAHTDNRREAELQDIKDSISKVIKHSFKDVYDLISNDEKMFDTFSPELREFEKVVKGMAETAETIASNRLRIEHIQDRLSGLDIDGVEQACTVPALQAL